MGTEIESGREVGVAALEGEEEEDEMEQMEDLSVDNDDEKMMSVLLLQKSVC